MERLRLPRFYVPVALGLAATVGVTGLVVHSIDTRKRVRVAEHAEALRDALEVRFLRMEGQIRSYAAYLSTTSELRHQDFADFYAYSTQGLTPTVTGWRAIAFMLEVPASGHGALAGWLAARARSLRELGYPPYRLNPGSTGEVDYPAVMVEPAASREGVFGFNLGVSAPRLRAAARAVATGELAASEPIRLSQDVSEAEAPTSILLVAPVRLRRSAAEGLPSRAGLMGAGVTPSQILADIARDLSPRSFVVELGFERGPPIRVRAGETSNVGWASEYTTSVRPLRLADQTLTFTYRGRLPVGADDLALVLGVVLLCALATWFGAAYVWRVELAADVIQAELTKKRAELRAASERGARAARLESLGQLVGGVAHDFNNLLTVVLGSLDELREELNTGAQVNAVEQAIAASQRGAELTSQLLAFGRKTALQPRTLDAAETMGSLQPILRRVVPERIELTVDVPAPGLLLHVDPTQLENALLNLVINAVDAIESAGRITVQVRAVHLDAATEEDEPVEPGDYVELSVHDDGRGMDATTRGRAFEPFYTTKPPGQGTGLGLSTLFGFVKQSGGTARIDSEPGRGTEVRMLLPRAEPSAAPAETPSVVPASPTVRTRILVVEDDPAVLNVIERMLARAGYEVDVARSGDAAWARLEGRLRPPDVLVTDSVMPGSLQGPDLIRRAAARWPYLQIVLLSGYPELAALGEDVLERCALLSKPFNQARLTAAIEDRLRPRGPNGPHGPSAKGSK